MKKMIVSVLIVLCVFLSLWVRWCYIEHKEMALSISGVIGEKRYLGDVVKNLMFIDSVKLDSVELRRGEKHYKIRDIVSFPCMVIYLPSVQEKICGSCLSFALDEARKYSEKLFNGNHLCIISLGDNPEVKERIYKKKVFVVDEMLINVPKAYMPYYFMLDRDGRISRLFCPDSSFDKYTFLYWENISPELL